MRLKKTMEPVNGFVGGLSVSLRFTIYQLLKGGDMVTDELVDGTRPNDPARALTALLSAYLNKARWRQRTVPRARSGGEPSTGASA